MGKFILGWRRKAGVATLAIACVFTVGWVNSVKELHEATWMTTKHTLHLFQSSPDGMSWLQIEELRHNVTKGEFAQWILGATSGRETFDILPSWGWSGAHYHFCGCVASAYSFSDYVRIHALIIPYPFVVVPLTLVSAYLLVIKPRPVKPAESM